VLILAPHAALELKCNTLSLLLRFPDRRFRAAAAGEHLLTEYFALFRRHLLPALSGWPPLYGQATLRRRQALTR